MLSVTVGSHEVEIRLDQKLERAIYVVDHHPQCPTCANLLVISAETGLNKWACNSCPYEFPITKQMTSRTKLKRKQIDDVLGGDEMWAHADQTQASCDKCNFNSAYFYQLQIRSADEPMTTFYRCVSCAHQWREN